MRADTPTHTNAVVNTPPVSKDTRCANDFVVAPMYVRDLTSAFAAYFLDWFATLAPELIIDIVKCGLDEGGFRDEVEHFKYQCEDDVDGDDNDLGYWPIEEHGPWIYGDVAVDEVAKLVFHHTRGWSIGDFSFYGYTVKEFEDLNEHIASLSGMLPART